MPAPKYQRQYEDMLKINKALFDELKLKSKKPKSAEFKEIQLKVLRVVRRNEDALCAKTENTHYSSFSTNLADKFWEQARANYPEIDICV
jgi:hypothetical protein